MTTSNGEWPRPIVAKTPRRGRTIAALAAVATIAVGGAVAGYFRLHDSAPPATSSDEDEIRSVVDIYATESDFTELAPILCAALSEHLLADRTPAQATAVARSDEQLYGTSSIERYESIEIDYNRARATILATTGGGSALGPLDDLRLTIGLTREDGAWKACTDPLPDADSIARIRTGVDRTNASAALTAFFDHIADADLVATRNGACGDMANILTSVTPASMPDFARAVGVISSVDETTVVGDTATVTVTLDNGVAPTVAAYSLIRTGATWKVCAEKVLD